MTWDVSLCPFSEPYFHKFQHDCRPNFSHGSIINVAFVSLNLILRYLLLGCLAPVGSYHCIDPLALQCITWSPSELTSTPSAFMFSSMWAEFFHEFLRDFAKISPWFRNAFDCNWLQYSPSSVHDAYAFLPGSNSLRLLRNDEFHCSVFD
jgi:hypothetical protein